MLTHSSPIRTLLVPAVLAAGLLGAGPVSAAETTTPQPTAAVAVVAGTGALTADGDGYVQLGGTYAVTGTIVGGSLRISGAGYFSSVHVTGWLSRTRLANGTTVYRFGDHRGTFTISGRTIVTRVVSHSIHLDAAGHGRAWLVGTGTYSANGHGSLPWAPAGTSTADPSTSTF